MTIITVYFIPSQATTRQPLLTWTGKMVGYSAYCIGILFFYGLVTVEEIVTELLNYRRFDYILGLLTKLINGTEVKRGNDVNASAILYLP